MNSKEFALCTMLFIFIRTNKESACLGLYEKARRDSKDSRKTQQAQ